MSNLLLYNIPVRIIHTLAIETTQRHERNPDRVNTQLDWLGGITWKGSDYQAHAALSLSTHYGDTWSPIDTDNDIVKEKVITERQKVELKLKPLRIVEKRVKKIWPMEKWLLYIIFMAAHDWFCFLKLPKDYSLFGVVWPNDITHLIKCVTGLNGYGSSPQSSDTTLQHSPNLVMCTGLIALWWLDIPINAYST